MKKLLLTILLVACGREEFDPRPADIKTYTNNITVTQSILENVESVKRHMGINKSISVIIEDLEFNLGECRSYKTEGYIVMSSKSLQNEDVFNYILAHELSHCVFNLKHVEPKFEGSCQTELMHYQVDVTNLECLRKVYSSLKKN